MFSKLKKAYRAHDGKPPYIFPPCLHTLTVPSGKRNVRDDDVKIELSFLSTVNFSANIGY